MLSAQFAHILIYLQYNPQEVALTTNKAKKSEAGRVQAGKDETISTEPPVAKPEVADATAVSLTEETAPDPNNAT